MNSKQLCKYMNQCEEPLDGIDPETDQPYHWKVWGVLTFQWFVTPSRARQLFDRWVKGIRKPQRYFVNWFAVVAHDRWNKETRIHFLLGGSEVSYEACWSVRWQDLSGGEVAISEYRPGAFVRHVLKNADVGHSFQVALDFGVCGSLDIEAD